jgi:cell division protein FtsB
MSTRSSPVSSLLRSAGPPAVALILMGFFAYNAVLGPNGVLASKDVRVQLAQRGAQFAALDQQRAELRNRVALLGRKGGADRDLADEEVRKLGLVRSDEVIVTLPDAPAPARK